jgi:xylulokinase
MIILGLDLSTQGLKCTIYNKESKTIQTESINFDIDLPHYNTSNGYHKSNLYVTSPTFMFVQALNLLLDRLQKSGFDFSTVEAISGTGFYFYKQRMRATTRISVLERRLTFATRTSLS